MGNQLGDFGKSIAKIDISESTTISNAIDCVKNGPPASLQFPTVFAGTAISFKVATTINGIYDPFHKSGSLYDPGAIANSLVIWLDPAVFYCVKYIKIVCGTVQSGADREIEVIHRNT